MNKFFQCNAKYFSYSEINYCYNKSLKETVKELIFIESETSSDLI